MGQTFSNSMCESNCQDINNFLTKNRPTYFNNNWEIKQYNINKSLSDNTNYQLNKNEISLSGSVKPGYVTISKKLTISFNKLNSLEIPLNIKINNADNIMILVVITSIHYDINDIIHDMQSNNTSNNIYFTALFNSSKNKNTVSYSLLSKTVDCEQIEWINNKVNKYIINITNNTTYFEIRQEFSNDLMKKSVLNNIDKISYNFGNNQNIMIHVIPFYPRGLRDNDSVSIRVV